MKRRPNEIASLDAAITLLHIVDHWRRASGFHRWTLTEYKNCNRNGRQYRPAKIKNWLQHLPLSKRIPEANFLWHINREFCDCQCGRFPWSWLLRGGVAPLHRGDLDWRQGWAGRCSCGLGSHCRFFPFTGVRSCGLLPKALQER